jgi:hypothetical protein
VLGLGAKGSRAGGHLYLNWRRVTIIATTTTATLTHSFHPSPPTTTPPPDSRPRTSMNQAQIYGKQKSFERRRGVIESCTAADLASPRSSTSLSILIYPHTHTGNRSQACSFVHGLKPQMSCSGHETSHSSLGQSGIDSAAVFSLLYSYSLPRSLSLPQVHITPRVEAERS